MFRLLPCHLNSAVAQRLAHLTILSGPIYFGAVIRRLSARELTTVVDGDDPWLVVFY